MNEQLSSAIKHYIAPEKAQELVATHPSLNLAGPTGAGKGTLATYLTRFGKYAPVVSDTTRQPRPHNNGYEVNGVDYWFIDEAEALKKVNQGAYIEVKAVHGTTMYGTSIAAYERVVESGQTPLLEIDVQGMEDLMRRFPEFEAIMLLPPDFATWQQRLDGRGDMSLEEKIRRFHSALDEIAKPFDNPRFYPVINTEVIDTAQVITSGEYKQSTYRDRATLVARELLHRINNFLQENE